MRRRPEESGHTIIEALMATLILLVGLIPVANLLVVAGTSNNAAHHATAAVAQASEVMEMLKAIPFEHLKAGGDLAADSPYLNTSEPPVIVDAYHDLRTYNLQRSVAGVGVIRTRWRITTIDERTLHIQVVSESTAALVRGRSRVELATFRSCTAEAPPMGCP